jgi:hypothetical protein
VVKLLIEDKRVNPTANDAYCLRAAAENGFAAVVLVLLQDGRVDPSILDNYALTNASANGTDMSIYVVTPQFRSLGGC